MKRKVKFLETRVVQDFRTGTKDEERFEAGKVYELEEASAKRWVVRGAAEYVGDDAKVSPPSSSAPAGAEGDAAVKRETRKRKMDAGGPGMEASEGDKPAQ